MNVSYPRLALKITLQTARALAVQGEGHLGVTHDYQVILCWVCVVFGLMYGHTFLDLQITK